MESLSRALTKWENSQARLERRMNAAEDDAETLLDAVRILASALPSTTAAGRKARSQARDLLVSKKISPPSTLGAPRNRPKTKKTKANKKAARIVGSGAGF